MYNVIVFVPFDLFVRIRHSSLANYFAGFQVGLRLKSVCTVGIVQR